MAIFLGVILFIIIIFNVTILLFYSQIAGGTIEDCCVLRGVMLNKDVTHPKMRRRIENPRILLLDCTLEYKKGRCVNTVVFCYIK